MLTPKYGRFSFRRPPLPGPPFPATRPLHHSPSLLLFSAGTLVGKSLLVAATSPFQQQNAGATALVSLDVFALQVMAGRSGEEGVSMCV